MPRKISQAGIDLIKSFEGFRAQPYQDTGGIWTIGYGHTKYVSGTSGPFTPEIAEEYLRADVASAENIVNHLIVAPLNDNQFAALVSLVFNVGAGPLYKTLGGKLNGGDYAGAAEQFSRWIYVNGVKIDGLINRRAREREVFLS